MVWLLLFKCNFTDIHNIIGLPDFMKHRFWRFFHRKRPKILFSNHFQLTKKLKENFKEYSVKRVKNTCEELQIAKPELKRLKKRPYVLCFLTEFWESQQN